MLSTIVKTGHIKYIYSIDTNVWCTTEQKEMWIKETLCLYQAYAV